MRNCALQLAPPPAQFPSTVWTCSMAHRSLTSSPTSPIATALQARTPTAGDEAASTQRPSRENRNDGSRRQLAAACVCPCSPADKVAVCTVSGARAGWLEEIDEANERDHLAYWPPPPPCRQVLTTSHSFGPFCAMRDAHRPSCKVSSLQLLAGTRTTFRDVVHSTSHY